MATVDRRTGIEVLDRDACLQLLAEDEVGRLGVITAGTPRIFPVNYALDGDAVVLLTADGTKLRDGMRAPACFEVDDFDREARQGWSVLVVWECQTRARKRESLRRRLERFLSM